MITNLSTLEVMSLVGLTYNKSTVEPKRCLILDVRTSSLEVDLRVPGNRDEFPFSQAKWSLPSYFPQLFLFRLRRFSFPVWARKLSSHRCETVSPSKDCLPVLYSTWYVVVAVMRLYVWTSVTVGITADVDCMSLTYCWTITWLPINRVIGTMHLVHGNNAWCITFRSRSWSRAWFALRVISTSSLL